MKKPIKVIISVTIYSEKEVELVEQVIAKGILRELDVARIATPKNVKLEKLNL